MLEDRSKVRDWSDVVELYDFVALQWLFQTLRQSLVADFVVEANQSLMMILSGPGSSRKGMEAFRSSRTALSPCRARRLRTPFRVDRPILDFSVQPIACHAVPPTGRRCGPER